MSKTKVDLTKKEIVIVKCKLAEGMSLICLGKDVNGKERWFDDRTMCF